MKKLKAYWKQYWHCYWNSILFDTDHRMITEVKYGKVTYIGCTCGKDFYGKPTIINDVLEIINKKKENA